MIDNIFHDVTRLMLYLHEYIFCAMHQHFQHTTKLSNFYTNFDLYLVKQKNCKHCSIITEGINEEIWERMLSTRGTCDVTACTSKPPRTVNDMHRSSSSRWHGMGTLSTLLAQLLMDSTHKGPGPRLNIKTVLSTYGDFHVKDKTAVRTSYL